MNDAQLRGLNVSTGTLLTTRHKGRFVIAI